MCCGVACTGRRCDEIWCDAMQCNVMRCHVMWTGLLWCDVLCSSSTVVIHNAVLDKPGLICASPCCDVLFFTVLHVVLYYDILRCAILSYGVWCCFGLWNMLSSIVLCILCWTHSCHWKTASILWWTQTCHWERVLYCAELTLATEPPLAVCYCTYWCGTTELDGSPQRQSPQQLITMRCRCLYSRLPATMLHSAHTKAT